MISKDSLLQVRKDVENNMGQEIMIKANLGRNKSVCKRGTIEKTFSNLFLIREEDTNSNISYSYADILTNNLEITYLNDTTLVDDEIQNEYVNNL